MLCSFRGFGEAIGLAVVLVAVYLALNVVVMVMGLVEVAHHPQVFGDWGHSLVQVQPNPALLLLGAILVFPKLALGLSGFETGVLVMPLIRGDATDTQQHPRGRIRNAHKLLTTTASIMSILLLSGSFVTTLLIPAAAFQEGGKAIARALAYLAHQYLGVYFGSAYDLSTICFLRFAGASAMTGLLNIVPRYLPRYGMVPDWARATKPLAILVTVIGIVVTLLFRANVNAQARAYATGFLAIMTSASIAVTLSARRHRRRGATLAFSGIAGVFIFTLGDTVIEQPAGLEISGIFIAAIVGTSLISRVWHLTELRVTEVVLDKTARQFIEEESQGTIHIIASHPDERNAREYLLKEREQRADNHIPAGEPVVFLEVTISDASEFAPILKVRDEEIEGYRVLRTDRVAIPNAIAAILLHTRDVSGKRPHVYFGWMEGNPVKHLSKFMLFGEGDIAPVTHEILRQAEPEPTVRPAIHIG